MEQIRYVGRPIRCTPASVPYNSASGITARLATTPEVLREAWSVRHAAYSARGFIERTAEGVFKDDCDSYPSSRTVVVYKNDAPVATVRVCLYAPESGIAGADAIPAMEVFREEIAGIFRQFHDSSRPPRGVEVMRLSRHPSLGADTQPVFGLFRMVGYLLLYLEPDCVVSAVRSHHTPFYSRLGLRKLTEPRPYPKLKFETALMAGSRAIGQTLQDCLPALGLVSKEDSNYEDFLAGHPVPVFGTGRSAAAVSGMFGGRLEHGERTEAPREGSRRRRSRVQDAQLVA